MRGENRINTHIWYVKLSREATAILYEKKAQDELPVLNVPVAKGTRFAPLDIRLEIYYT